MALWLLPFALEATTRRGFHLKLARGASLALARNQAKSQRHFSAPDALEIELAVPHFASLFHCRYLPLSLLVSVFMCRCRCCSSTRRRAAAPEKRRHVPSLANQMTNKYIPSICVVSPICVCSHRPVPRPSFTWHAFMHLRGKPDPFLVGYPNSHPPFLFHDKIRRDGQCRIGRDREGPKCR